jgi:aminopeptidase N
MRKHFALKSHCVSLAALLMLGACGGEDASQSLGMRASAAAFPASEPALAAPSAPVADASIDKTVLPIEMPDTVMPVNYQLWFRPNPDLSSFDGRADVQIKVLKPVTSIVVAARRLQFVNGSITLQPGNVSLIATPQDDGDFYQLRPASGQIPAGTYSLHMEWRGIINFKTYDDPEKKTGGSCGDDPYPGCSAAQGVFRVDLKATDGSTSGAILTQGESNLARQWFPGWDEPAFRPTYEVSADVPKNWRVVSNAAERPAAEVDGNYKRVSFEKTPPMPSYLLFFGGGKFDVLEDEFSSPLPDGKKMPLRIFTPPGMKDWAAPAMQQTKQALDYYYRYTGIPLPLAKFDTIAANDAFEAEKQLHFGGMENWGSILEFADDILPAPGSPMSDYGMSVLTHEAAHQWFGDLVTHDWWDDVWLNESFASFFEKKTRIRFFPERFSWENEVKRKYRIIASDLKSTSFPIQPNFNGWASNDFVLSAGQFVYHKGAQVLKMMEGYLGDEVMRRGLQTYLANYAFGNVTPKRLWDELARASGEPMGAIGDSFVRQTGVPLLSLNTQCDLTSNETVVTLNQRPFPNQNRYPATKWTIPITLAYGSGLGNRKTVAMKDTATQVRLNGCGAVLADPSGQDYYVVNYGDNAWRELLGQKSALQDPPRLLNLRLGTDLLVDAGLADPSRKTSIDSIAVAPSVAARLHQAVAPQERGDRPLLRYQGRVKAKAEQKSE